MIAFLFRQIVLKLRLKILGVVWANQNLGESNKSKANQKRQKRAKMANGTKEQIIKNTRNYLKSLGFSKSISLSAILKAIGVSKGVFYYYFKDKDELFYEVIIPEIRKKEIEINKKISKLPSLHERLHFMFELFTNESLENELKNIENFTIHLFFEDNEIGKLRAFRKIHDEISQSRKSLIMQQIRYYNIKITKDISILVDYIIDTMIFYHIFRKKLKGKSPKREIISVIDMLCRMLEGEKVAKKARNYSIMLKS